MYSKFMKYFLPTVYFLRCFCDWKIGNAIFIIFQQPFFFKRVLLHFSYAMPQDIKNIINK